jgi:diguanylate cyclase (GGDEF)-like protein
MPVVSHAGRRAEPRRPRIGSLPARQSRMPAIDVLTAYSISGAASLVGAGILRMADSPRPAMAAAIRMCIGALLMLGISLLAFTVVGSEQGLRAQFLTCIGCLGAMLLWAWGIGLMEGRRMRAGAMIGLWLFTVTLLVVGLPFGVAGLASMLALGLTISSLLAAFLGRGLVFSPASLESRMLGLMVLAIAGSCMLRLLWALDYDGPPQVHLLHMPVLAQQLFAVSYGVLPVVLSTMLLVKTNAELRAAIAERAASDELTGALTRRALRERAPALVERCRRDGLEVAVLMLDLDHFKSINDGHGHGVGDEVLRCAARLWREHMRAQDLLARYGGEEFVALVPVVDLRMARQVGERLRSAVADAPWRTLTESSVRATTSLGVTLVAAGESLDDALKRADEALYRAKREGRNQVQLSLSAA